MICLSGDLSQTCAILLTLTQYQYLLWTVKNLSSFPGPSPLTRIFLAGTEHFMYKSFRFLFRLSKFTKFKCFRLTSLLSSCKLAAPSKSPNRLPIASFGMFTSICAMSVKSSFDCSVVNGVYFNINFLKVEASSEHSLAVLSLETWLNSRAILNNAFKTSDIRFLVFCEVDVLRRCSFKSIINKYLHFQTPID